MGIGKTIRNAGYSIAQNASVARAIPHIKRIISGIPKDELYASTETTESKREFGLKIYDMLPGTISDKMDRDWFGNLFVEQMDYFLGKKSIKKKIDKEKKKRIKKQAKKNKK